MDVRINYCRHCHSRYNYQASGEGCLDPDNDENYCPDCMHLINEALKKAKPTTYEGYEELSVEEADRIRNIANGILKESPCNCLIGGQLKGNLDDMSDYLNDLYPKFLYIDDRYDGYVFIGKGCNIDGSSVYKVFDYNVSDGGKIGSHWFVNNSAGRVLRLAPPMDVMLRRCFEEIQSAKMPYEIDSNIYDDVVYFTVTDDVNKN